MIQKPKIDRLFKYPKGVLPPWVFGVTVLGFKYYDWQAETLEAWGQGLPVALCAANGSGKTQVVITTALLWFLYTYPEGIAPVTSGSWNQLINQLWPAIEQHAHRFPQWHWRKLNVSTNEGGKILLFSVTDPGLAEGFHPKYGSTSVNAHIIDEAKSVDDTIFDASERCTAKYRMLSSSPGEPSGRFYQCFRRLSSFYYTKQVSSYDCLHIDDVQREKDKAKHGEGSSWWRSRYKAEFTDDEGPGLIYNRGKLAKCIANPPVHKPGRLTAFCDYAGGRDENVLALCDGNKIEIIEAWCEEDTMQAVYQFINHFERLKLIPTDIFGDNGGLGKSMIDRLWELGWYIIRVNNQDTPPKVKHEKLYANRGTEIWFETVKDVENCSIILPDDQILFDQMTSRRRLTDEKGRLIAEPKKLMHKRGLTSPDRADAVLGALWARRSGSISSLEDIEKITIPENPFFVPIDYELINEPNMMYFRP